MSSFTLVSKLAKFEQIWLQNNFSETASLFVHLFVDNRTNIKHPFYPAAFSIAAVNALIYDMYNNVNGGINIPRRTDYSL